MRQSFGSDRICPLLTNAAAPVLALFLILSSRQQEAGSARSASTVESDPRGCGQMEGDDRLLSFFERERPSPFTQRRPFFRALLLLFIYFARHLHLLMLFFLEKG